MSLERVTRELIDLTPKMAADLLAKNKGNRGLAAGRVRALAAEIERGGWTFNGQPIIVDGDGNLLDGQHRCAAVVLSKKSARTLIVRGVHRDAFPTIDCGRSRSGADVLTAGGMSSANRVAAVLRLVWQNELGVLGSMAAEHRPANNDIATLATDYPTVIESVRYTNGKRHMSNATVAFVHWETTRKNPKDARPFWDAVETGEGLSRGSPALKLRDTLLANATMRAKHRPLAILEFCIRAWVCYLANHQVSILKPGILDHAKMRRSNGDIFIPMTTEEAAEVVRDAQSTRKNRDARA